MDAQALLFFAVCLAGRSQCFAVTEIEHTVMSRGGRFQTDRLCHCENFTRYSAGELDFLSQLFLFYACAAFMPLLYPYAGMLFNLVSALPTDQTA